MRESSTRRILFAQLLATSLLLSACERDGSDSTDPGEASEPEAVVRAETPSDGAPPPISDARPGVDPATGMLMAEGWTTVRDHCIACHSPRQFLNQRGTRTTWLEIIRWMQEKAGLGRMTAENEARALDYLATNFGPEEGTWRRAPIPPLLLPPNPYPSEIRRSLDAARAKSPPGEPPSSERPSSEG